MIDRFLDLLNEHLLTLGEIFIAGCICFFLEKINPAEKDTPFFKKDLKAEGLMAALNVVIFTPLIGIAVAYMVVYSVGFYFEYKMFATQIQALPLIVQIILGALILDFSTYWRHRFTHYYMWPYHAVHHSARQITWLTSLRLHPGDLFAATLVDSFILFFLGFNGPGFLGAMIVIRLMNYFTHININVKFPKPLRYILASPHYHRWHHADYIEAYNTNFCGTFPIFDLAFGTYYHPEDLPARYGISPREQKNFPTLNYFGWIAYPFKRNYNFLKKRLVPKK